MPGAQITASAASAEPLQRAAAWSLLQGPLSILQPVIDVFNSQRIIEQTSGKYVLQSRAGSEHR